MAERVLITGARAPAALDLARSFHAAGFEAHMADCAPSRMSSLSRAVTKVHRYPSPRADFTRFARSAAELIARLDPVMVIPTCEEVFYLAALNEPRVFAPDIAGLRKLHSKVLFAHEAAALGLSVPRTFQIRSSADLAAHLANTHDIVLKPEYSRFGARALVGPSRQVAAAVLASDATPWVLQQRVHGSEVSFYAASVGRRLAAFSAYRSPWKFEGGAGYAFEPLGPAMHDRLVEVADALARKLVPNGQFACDLIVDEDETPWLLECNPRATSGVHLFDRAPSLAMALLGRKADVLLAPQAAPKHVGPALWCFGLPTALKENRLSEWRARRAASADVISAAGDKAPILGAFVDTMRLSLSALALGRTLTEASTADIEWNGEPL